MVNNKNLSKLTMKNIYTLLIALAIGCTAQAQQPAKKLSGKELALSNEFLDLDVNLFMKQRPQPNNDENIAKAITYRFFKHVHVVKGYYESDLKEGKEINVSEADFMFFMESLKSVNAGFKKRRSQGIKVTPKAFDDKYLTELIK
jgi:hypothetical protein